MNPDHHHKALPKGDRLHWYRIDSILGQGGFGITYLAEDTNLEQRVAIKEYLPNELAVRVDETTVQPISEEYGKMYRWGLDRFLKEAKTLAKFKHPNIVRVQSFFEQNNTAYMVMEYEEGQSLAQVIKAGQLRGEQKLLALLDPILDGLALVHDAGFIHRDIKPDNVFLRQDGSPVLLDFGSARHAISGQTRTLTSLVTPGYAPFEQYHDADGKQGPWTDIYALGATIYRAITGNTPVEAIKRGMARINHATDPYLPLADLKGNEYSEHFLDALDCALRFLEADRPQTVASWQRMLHGTEAVPPQAEIASPTQHAQAADAVPPTQPEVSGALDIDFSDPETLAPTTPAPKTVPTVPESKPAAPAQTPSAAARHQVKPPAPKGRHPAVWIGAAMLVIGAVVATVWFSQQQQPTSAPAARTAPATDVDAQRIAELQRAALAAMTAGRLTSPEGDSALDLYRQILRLQPGHAAAQSSIARLLDEHLKAANQAIDAQRFDSADAHIAGAERIDPQAAGVQLIKEKSASAQAQRRQAAADEVARAARERERQAQIAALLSSAERALRNKRFDAASADYQRVLGLDAGNGEATAGLRAVATERQAARDQAAQARRRRITQLLAEAQKLSAAGDYAGALGRYQQVLDLDAGSAVASTGKRTAQAQLDAQRSKAERAAQREQRIDAAVAEGRRELNAGRFNDAEAAFRRALKLDPGNRAAKQGIARIKRATAGEPQTPRTAATKPYTLAILPWTLRGTDNYEQSIFGGLQQALQSRRDSVRLTHSHYRNFAAGKSSKKLSAGGISVSDLTQIWVKKQGLFSEAELNERGARSIARRLGVDAVLLARVSVAAETAQIEVHFFEQRNGAAKRASAEFRFPVWGYHEESAAQVKALVLRVLPTRI